VTGDRGRHRKGQLQLRVLGSPSALRTKEPRTGGPPGGKETHEVQVQNQSPIPRPRTLPKSGFRAQKSKFNSELDFEVQVQVQVQSELGLEVQVQVQVQVQLENGLRSPSPTTSPASATGFKVQVQVQVQSDLDFEVHKSNPKSDSARHSQKADFGCVTFCTQNAVSVTTTNFVYSYDFVQSIYNGPSILKNLGLNNLVFYSDCDAGKAFHYLDSAMAGSACDDCTAGRCGVACMESCAAGKFSDLSGQSTEIS
jgi:hypothetical protein